MAKILHVLRNMGLGGTEKTAEIFCRELHRRGHEVAVMYNVRGDLTRFPRFQEFLPANMLVGYDVEPQGSQMLLHFRPEIVHVYRSGFPEWPYPGRDTRGKTKFVETNVFGFIDPNPHVAKSLFMSEWLMNNPVNRDLKLALPDERFDFVNNPIDQPATQEKLDLGIQEGVFVLGRCGRPENGIYDDINVRAAMILKAKGAALHFLVMAPPPKMVDDLKRWNIPFTALEPTTDPIELSRFYNTIDVLAHARIDGETFGCNIAEAMIHGKPVVTHQAVASEACPGVFQSQTTLVDHGVNGYVAPHDAPAYAGMLGLLRSKNRRDLFGKAARTKAMAEFETGVVMDKLERIYSEILS